MAEKKQQFFKIPNQMIKEMDGFSIKLYAKLLIHCHGKKTTCWMEHATISQDTGIKSSTTITKAKKALQKAGWIKVTKRYQTCDFYTVKRVNKKFVMMPYDILNIPANLLHLYLYILMICVDEITERKIAKIRKDLKITDPRTLNKMVDELQDLNLLFVSHITNKSEKDPEKKFVDTWQMIKINHVIHDSKTMYFVMSNHVIRGSITMYLVIPNYVIRDDKLDSFKKDYIELNSVKWKNTQNRTYLTRNTEQEKISNTDSLSQRTAVTECPLPDKDTNTDTDPVSQITEDTENPLPDLNPNIKQEEKESFVAESDSLNKYLSDENIPPKINRKIERKKDTAFLHGEYWGNFLDAKKTGFNGKKEIVEKYVNHELLLWDQEEKPMDEEQLKRKFEKEMFTGHAIAKHFISMTDAQRKAEIELNTVTPLEWIEPPVETEEEKENRLKAEQEEREKREAVEKAKQEEQTRIQREMEEQADLMNRDPHEYMRLYS